VLEIATKPIALDGDTAGVTRWMDALAVTVLVLLGAAAALTSAIMAWAGTTTPIRNTAIFWFRSIRPDLPTGGRCPSSICMNMAAASIFSPRSPRKSHHSGCSPHGGCSAPLSAWSVSSYLRIGRRVGGPFSGFVALILLAYAPSITVTCSSIPRTVRSRR